MTLDVSKLSGELKVDHQLSRRRQGSGSSALMLNIDFMSVTLDVSKRSGWLNFAALYAEGRIESKWEAMYDAARGARVAGCSVWVRVEGCV